MKLVYSFNEHNSLNRELRLHNERKIIMFFFLGFFLLLALRNQDIGIDLSNYKYYFEDISRISWSRLSNHELEFGYVLLNKIVSGLGLDFQFFLAVVAFLSVFPMAILYYKESEDAMLSIGIFINVSVFSICFSGLRQAIAMSISAIAYYCVKNKKILWFLVCVFIAYNFHASAFVMLAMYPIYYAKIPKKALYIIALVMAVVFVFRSQVFSFLVDFLSDEYQERYKDLQYTSAYAVLILFILFTAYVFLEMDESNVDENTRGLRNILLLVTCVQLFASVHTLAMRMNYYFIPFVPILISKISYRGNKEDRFIVNIITVILTVFFFGYFFYEAYAGEDVLQIFPYKPFWE